MSGATLSNLAGTSITINTALRTYSSGKFELAGSLLTNDLSLSGTAESWGLDLIDINGNLQIENGTSLNSKGSKPIYIGKNLIVNGTLRQTGNKDILMDGGGCYLLGGTGSIEGSQKFIIQNYNKAVPANAKLTIVPDFLIDGKYTLTNNGTITLKNGLDGNDTRSNWTNTASSVLNYEGGTSMFPTYGQLEAISNGNTVNFCGSTYQTIKLPNRSGNYYHLITSGNGVKSLEGSITINGNLTLSGSVQLDVSSLSHNINLYGKWINSSSNNIPFNPGKGTVNLKGIASQNIGGDSKITFYDLVINNSNKSVKLSSDVIILNTLSLTSTALDLAGNSLIIKNPDPTALNRTTGYIISEKTNGSGKISWNTGSASGPYIFPFGTINGSFIPFILEPCVGNTGTFTIATYGTTANNTPYPLTISNMKVNGFDISSSSVDRFWLIYCDTSFKNALYTFTYADNEIYLCR
jgi:hypothetical protein